MKFIGRKEPKKAPAPPNTPKKPQRGGKKP